MTEKDEKEKEVGNCSLSMLIGFLQRGWKIKRFIYRGFRKNREPCCTVPYDHGAVCLETAWFEYIPNSDLPKMLEEDHPGFNHVIFVRD